MQHGILCAKPGRILYGKNIYELNFKPGWNIVKYEVLNCLKTGMERPMSHVVLWKTLDELPADVQYIYFAK